MLIAAATLAGCVRDAHIATPSSLAAATDRLELRGMGGGTSGRFTLASSAGRFTRGADRLDYGGYVEQRGGGSFTLSGPEVGGTELSGRCRFDQGKADFGSVSVGTEPFLYTCSFAREDEAIAGELVLEAAPHLYKEKREGSLRFGGERIALRSVHQDQGGGLAAHTPLGYVFEIDGRQVGAIDLNGLNKTVYAPRDPQQREAVLAASMALAILWDPAGED